MASKDTSTSSTSEKTDEDKKKDPFSKEEIEAILKKEVSSGYSTEEIQKIIESAEPVYAGQKVNLSHMRPRHQNTHEYVFDEITGAISHPECYFEVNGQPLKIKSEFSVSPDTEIAETRLHSGFDTNDKTSVKHLYFKGNAGVTVEVSALVKADDIYIGEHVGNLNYDSDTTVASVLIDWERTFQACVLITDSPLIPKSYYRMKIEKMTQITHSQIEFELKFIQDTYHYNTDLETFGSMSKAINVIRTGSGSPDNYSSDALDKISKSSTNTATDTKGTGKESDFITTLQKCGTMKKPCKCTKYKRKDCNVKYIQCVYHYQKALKQLGYYLKGKHDGLFCYMTHNATIKFQKDNKLTVDGIVGKQTMGKLVEKLKKLGK